MAVALVEGMPVVLTNHIDRDKALFRGRVGTIRTIVMHHKESSQFEKGTRVLQKLPKFVLVKFNKADGTEADWRLPGLDEQGLYPICPCMASWFLDKDRKHPVLRIFRRQLPLAPAFAMTAYAAQGQTFADGTIVDLCIGKGTNPLDVYVALTRAKRREDVLIFQPFSRELFLQGEQKGPRLLLQHLRGEHIDWKAVEAGHMPSARCVDCGLLKYKDAFRVHQWNRKDGQRRCMQCVNSHRENGVNLCCNCCGIGMM